MNKITLLLFVKENNMYYLSMNVGRWWVLGFLSSLFCILPLYEASAASAANEYFEVNSDSQWVSDIKVFGKDFHVVTSSLPENTAVGVTVRCVRAGEEWRLEGTANPNSELRFFLSAGDIKKLRLVNSSTTESKQHGQIIVYKIDVVVGGISEEKEEIEGAFLQYGRCSTSYANTCLEISAPFAIKVWPETPPDKKEGIKLTVPVGHLLVKTANGYQRVTSGKSYTYGELKEKTFLLHGHSISSGVRDRLIKVENTRNGCFDVARYTVFGLRTKASSGVPNDRTRRKFGVGEEVEIMLRPVVAAMIPEWKRITEGEIQLGSTGDNAGVNR